MAQAQKALIQQIKQPRAPGISLVTASTIAIAAISPPERTKSPSEISSFRSVLLLPVTAKTNKVHRTHIPREYKKGGNKYFFIWDFNYPAEDNRYLIGTAYNNKRPELSKTHYKDNGTAKLDTEIKATEVTTRVTIIAQKRKKAIPTGAKLIK